MFGGGEEYFQDPPSYDRDTLQRFCAFCTRLRRLEKPGKKGITECCTLAREVGDTLEAYELVVGTVFRHIKTWVGQRQLACWYVLDKLCKDCPDKYGFCASKYVLEIGRDYMPFEDPEYSRKYETLVEHWEDVFPRHVVDSLWLSRKERVLVAQRREEFEEQQRAEEEEWRRTELAMQDEEGLNAFGQPCIDYLQGRCTWGDQCTLYHPPGEEGSLPPECRMGDWKCSACGVINRHYRRRCVNCVREKPQYKCGRQPPKEDVLLSTPDPTVQHILRQQFGYNPYEEAEAVAHWKRRCADTSVTAYIAERRAAYKVRILRRPPSNPLETHCQHQKHFPEPQRLDEFPDGVASVEESTAKRMRVEQLVPPGTPPDKAVGVLAQMVVERGVRDVMTPQVYEALGATLRSLSEETSPALAPATAENLLAVCTLAHTAWSADKKGMSFFERFFKQIRGIEGKLGLTNLQRDQLLNVTGNFAFLAASFRVVPPSGMDTLNSAVRWANILYLHMEGVCVSGSPFAPFWVILIRLRVCDSFFFCLFIVLTFFGSFVFLLSLKCLMFYFSGSDDNLLFTPHQHRGCVTIEIELNGDPICIFINQVVAIVIIILSYLSAERAGRETGRKKSQTFIQRYSFLSLSPSSSQLLTYIIQLGTLLRLCRSRCHEICPSSAGFTGTEELACRTPASSAAFFVCPSENARDNGHPESRSETQKLQFHSKVARTGRRGSVRAAAPHTQPRTAAAYGGADVEEQKDDFSENVFQPTASFEMEESLAWMNMLSSPKPKTPSAPETSRKTQSPEPAARTHKARRSTGIRSAQRLVSSEPTAVQDPEEDVWAVMGEAEAEPEATTPATEAPPQPAASELWDELWQGTQPKPVAAPPLYEPGQQTPDLETPPKKTAPRGASIDRCSAPQPNSLLASPRWQSTMHNRFTDPHPLYSRYVTDYYQVLRDFLASSADPMRQTLAQASAAYLHADATLMLLEFVASEAMSVSSCAGRDSAAVSRRVESDATHVLLGEAFKGLHASQDGDRALPWAVLMVDVLARQLWDRAVELSSKHVVKATSLLYLLRSRLPVSSSTVLLVQATALWVCYINRHGLRRIQNVKCFTVVLEGSLLSTTRAPPQHRSWEHGDASLRVAAEWVDSLERRTLSHLLMRYITSKDADLQTETARDPAQAVQLCLTHCWSRLQPNVRIAALFWLQKQKQKQQPASSSTTRLPGFLETVLAQSGRSAKDVFQRLTQVVQETAGFCDMEADRACLRHLSCRGGASCAGPSGFPAIQAALGPLKEYDQEEAAIGAAFEALGSQRGEAFLGAIHDLHQRLPQLPHPSVWAAAVGANFPILSGSLVAHILYREWPRLAAAHPVRSEDEGPSIVPVSASERHMLGALWGLLRHVNILDVTRMVLLLLPTLGGPCVGGRATMASSVSNVPQNDESAASSPTRDVHCQEDLVFRGVLPVVAAVMRCVVAYTPVPLVRLVFQQVVEGRELAALPLHPYVLEFLLRLLRRSLTAAPSNEVQQEVAQLAQQFHEWVAALCPEVPMSCSTEMRRQQQWMQWWAGGQYAALWSQLQELAEQHHDAAGLAGETDAVVARSVSSCDTIHGIMTDLDKELRVITIMATLQARILRLRGGQKDLVRAAEDLDDADSDSVTVGAHGPVHIPRVGEGEDDEDDM
eukprot:gene7377-5192_t